MSHRLPSLLLLTGLAAFAAAAADAAGFTNMNNHAAGMQSSQATQLPGRQPGHGFGYGAPPPYGAPDSYPHRQRVTIFNSNDQFDNIGDLPPAGGGVVVKPGKSSARQ